MLHLGRYLAHLQLIMLCFWQILIEVKPSSFPRSCMKMESPSVPLSWLCPSAASFTCSGPSCYCRGPTYPTHRHKTTPMGERKVINVNGSNRCQGLLKYNIPWRADWTVPGKRLTAWRSWRIGRALLWSLKNILLLRTWQKSRRQTKVLTLACRWHDYIVELHTTNFYFWPDCEIHCCFHTDRNNENIPKYV